MAVSSPLVVYSDELGLAVLKDKAMPAFTASLTGALKDSLLPHVVFAGQDWAVEARKLLGQSMRSHFVPTDSVWDIFVCLSILNHERVLPSVALSVAERKSPRPSEADKDDARIRLKSFLTDVLTMRNKLEHGAPLPLIALSTAVDSMQQGLELLGERKDPSLHALHEELTRLAASSDSATSEQQVPASVFGLIHLRRVFSSFVGAYKDTIADCRKVSVDIKHLENVGCSCSRTVWRHHLADGSIKKSELPGLLKDCIECTATMADCHEVASVCAHLKDCLGCRGGLTGSNLTAIVKTRNAFAHGSLNAIEIYDALLELEDASFKMNDQRWSPPGLAEEFWKLTLEGERVVAMQGLLERARKAGECPEAASQTDISGLLKHIFYKGKECSACKQVYSGVSLKELSKVASDNAKCLGASLALALRALDRPLQCPNVEVQLNKTPSPYSMAAQLPISRTRSAFPMVGRDEILRDAIEKLLRGLRVGLHGRSGVGKSLLAREIVVSLECKGSRGATAIPFKYFRAIQASSRASLMRDWLAFARALFAFGALAFYPDDPSWTDEKVLESVREPVALFLCGDHSSAAAHEFFLLIDDVSSMEVANMLQGLLTTSAGGEPQCGLLFTAVTVDPLTRLSAEPTEVTTLSLEHCISIIAEVDEGYRTMVDLHDFVQRELVCHTLTVCVFAKLLRLSREATLEDKFRAVASALPGDELAAATDDHPRGLDGFVRLAVERLESEMGDEALVTELLTKCVVLGLDGTAIPETILGSTAATEGRALGLFDLDENSVFKRASVHKLVRASMERLLVSRGRLADESSWLNLAEGMIRLMNCRDGTLSGRQSREAPVFGCLLKFLSERVDVKSALSDAAKSTIAATLVAGSQAAEIASSLAIAKVYAERALEILDTRGTIEKDLMVADCHYALGSVATTMGEYMAAEEHHQKGLDIEIQKHGEKENERVASTYHALADLKLLICDYNEAHNLHSKALRLKRTVYKTDLHENVAASFHALGTLATKTKNYDKALFYLKREMIIRRKLNEMGMGTAAKWASSFSSFGELAYNMKDYEEARKYHNAALQIQRKFYGTIEHVDVASSYHALGMVEFSLKNYEEARRLHHTALDIEIKVYGTDKHADVAASYFELGNVARLMENLEEAAESYSKANAIWRVVYGSVAHPHVAESYKALANVEILRGEVDSARGYLEKALAILRTTDSIQARQFELILGRLHLPVNRSHTFQ